MSLSVSDLFKPDTRDEVVSFFLTLAADVGLPVTTWRAGDPTRTILYLAGQKLSDLGAVIQSLVNGGFLDTATGDFLTLLARYVYGVERDPARAASGQVTLTNAKASPDTIQPAALVVAHETSGKTYRSTNTAAIVLPASGTLTVDILAEEVGTASDAATGTITALVSTLLGVTVTNAAPVLGRDAETDAALRDRARSAIGALSPNGPAAAYEYIAKSTDVLVNRVRVDDDSNTGDVTVTIASPNGEVIAADVATVDEAIQTQVVPLTVTATTQSASPVTVPVTCEVWIYSSANLTNAEVTSAIESQLASYFQTIPIGGDYIAPGPGKVYVDKLRGQIERVSDSIFHATISAPAADVSLAATAVAVLGTVTVTVNQVEPPA